MQQHGRGLKVTSLFSGAGGLDVGLHQAGHELLLLCDSDAGARQVLKAAFPGVRIHDDVTSLERLPEETELLVAGFPCVDVSRAGLRRGLEGQSTGLVRHVFRLLQRAKDERRPVPWVLLENVEALLDRHGGDPPVMQYCARQFIEMGYTSWAYRVVNSAGFGLPNRRRRVFLVASLHGDARDVLLSPGTQRCTGGCMKAFGQRCYPCHAAELRARGSHAGVSYALDMGNAMSPAGEDVVPTFTTSNERMLLLLSGGASGMLRVEDAERLQGFEEGHTRPCWPVQTPGVGAHRGHRLRSEADMEALASKRWDLLGNAVTVPVARWLGERLANPYNMKYFRRGVADKRFMHLVKEGLAPEQGAALDAAAGLGPAPAHPWGWAAADQLQDALIFEYLTIKQRKKEVVRRRARRERMAAAAEAAAAGADNADELWAAVDAPQPEAEAGDGSSSEASGASEDEEEALDVGQGEAAELMAVVRAARRAEARERAAQQAQQEQQHQEVATPAPAAPATPLDGTTAPAPGISPTGSIGEGSNAATDTAEAPQASAGAEEEDGGSRPPDGSEGGTPAARSASGEAKAQRRLARLEAEAEQKHLFQAAIVRRKERGKMQQQARQQGEWDREAWPRAAWYLRGEGCYGCEDNNEYPVPAPFLPLGEFIREVGREASQQEIHTYLHRMREKGWDVDQTIEKLLHNGTRISAEAHEVVRIPGLLTDADMIGDLVWAWDPAAKVWWPAEKLDPLRMPAGRDLPGGALNRLSSDEKLVSLPQYASLAAKVPAEQRHSDRRVLVLYLPISNGGWRWVNPQDLEAFEGNTARETEAGNLIKSNGGRWKKGEEMVRALKDARSSLWVKQNRDCLEADRMRRTRAAAAAGAINLKQRCGQCKTCMNNFAGQRRYDCLTQRMKAAALSGHAGAQVGINGEAALGARVDVWWEGDQTFYSGYLAHYDAVATEHTVCYDDGEVGMHRLWQHDERIRLVSGVEQWARDAVLARHLLAQAQERLRSREGGRRGGTAAAAPPPPPPTAEQQEQKPAYVLSTEELRRRNRQAFEILVGSAVRGMEANGAVPDLTADERQIVAATQQAARKAAHHAPQPQRAAGAGAGAGPSTAPAAPSKGKGRRALPFDEEAQEEAVASAAGGAGRSRRKRAASEEAAFDTSESEGAEDADESYGGGGGGAGRRSTRGGGAGQGPHQHSLAAELAASKRFKVDKCGQCKHCMNPKLKKACVVVLEQRKALGLRGRYI